jgi:drug/metabolite transporter (DMT)-like permease
MLEIGILLAAGSAVLCGCADVFASRSAQRLGAMQTASLSLATGAFALALFGILAARHLSLSPHILLLCAPIGLVAGLATAVGYSAGYRGLGLGPLAIVSPIIATDGAIASVLAILLLHEHINAWQIVTLSGILLGTLLASTDLAECTRLLRTPQKKLLIGGGVLWGMGAALAFGLMLFGIGAGAEQWGWFPSLFWSRLFAATALAGAMVFRGRRARKAPKEFRVVPTQSGALRGTVRRGTGLALVVGVVETTGLVLYSMGTQVADTSIVAMIASTFVLIPLLTGIYLFKERPAFNQMVGVTMVVVGLVLLGIKPT